MRFISRALAVVLSYGILVGCQTPFPGQLQPKDQPTFLNLDTVVKVIREEGSGKTRGFVQGSGVVIWSNAKKSSILTGRHVVGEKSEIFIETRSGERIIGKVAWTHPNPYVDLAIVSVPLHLSAIPLSLCEEVKIGERVFSVAHPQGYPWSVGVGVVTGILGKDTLESNKALQDIVKHLKQIQTSAYAYLGSSGGELINAKGELVGVIVAILQTQLDGEWAATLAEPIFSSIADITMAVSLNLQCVVKTHLLLNTNRKVMR